MPLRELAASFRGDRAGRRAFEAGAEVASDSRWRASSRQPLQGAQHQQAARLGKPGGFLIEERADVVPKNRRERGGVEIDPSASAAACQRRDSPAKRRPSRAARDRRRAAGGAAPPCERAAGSALQHVLGA